jgi:plasmid stability protein
MDDLTIDGLDDKLMEFLRLHAEQNGRSVEDEALAILQAGLGDVSLPKDEDAPESAKGNGPGIGDRKSR